MIYSIETLPIVLFSKIAETNNLSLLSDENLSNEKLDEIWNKIREDYQKYEKNPTALKTKMLKEELLKENGRYQTIITALEALKYGEDADMLKILKEYGYSLNGSFKDGLDVIVKQVENLKNKILRIDRELQSLLDTGNDETSIYEILANINVALGGVFDIKTVTVIEYIFYKKSLNKLKK